MEYNFVNTKQHFKINGNDFFIDIGEVAVAEKAKALLESVKEENFFKSVSQAIDGLFGEGSAGRIFEGVSHTNEIQVCKLALEIGAAIGKRRVELLTVSFANVTELAEPTIQ